MRRLEIEVITPSLVDITMDRGNNRGGSGFKKWTKFCSFCEALEKFQHYTSECPYLTNDKITKKNSAHADGGPRSRVCARETLRSAPHRHERKFSGTCFYRVTLKHLPQPLKSHISCFGPLRQPIAFWRGKGGSPK